MTVAPNPIVLRVLACGSAGATASPLAARLRADPGTAGMLQLSEVPGDAGHTRGLAAAAPDADVALLVVDVHAGVTSDLRRDLLLAARLAIPHIVLAIDGIDVVAAPQAAFDVIQRGARAYAAALGMAEPACIPVSSRAGDNVHTHSLRTPWYHGPALTDLLETIVVHDRRDAPLRMIVQRPDAGRERGYTGNVVSGSLAPGQRVRLVPSGQVTTVTEVRASGGASGRGTDVTLTLADAVDVRPGDMLCAAAAPASAADQFEVTLLWLDTAEMLPGRSYLVQAGGRTVGATFAAPKHRIDPATLEHLAAHTLRQDEMGVCNVHLDTVIPFDPYAADRQTGSLAVIDRERNVVVGVALIDFALRRAHNIHWQSLTIDKGARADAKGQRPCIVWFTGLSGSGKSTIANVLEKRLHALGCHTALLDGDNVRHGLNKDLGFTDADRVENIRRVAEVARLMVDAGLIVLVSFISPFRAERRMARGLVGTGEFCEVFLDVPLDVAEARDVKGLYAKARHGELKHFTGIDSPYEAPEHPELAIATADVSPDLAAERIVAYLRQRGVIRA